MAFTTDSYSVDQYCEEHGCSRFTAVIETAGIPEEDLGCVSSYAMFILNTSPGYRPSDAAYRAVREYKANPDRVRSRPSGCDPDSGRRPF